MIYKDSLSQFDTDEKPAHRYQESCINCSASYSSHYNWACFFSGRNLGFYHIDADSRYLTLSMTNSIIHLEVAVKKVPSKDTCTDISNWKSWAHKADGDCPCGIKKEMCDYHND